MRTFSVVGFKKILCTLEVEAESMADAVKEAIEVHDDDWDESDTTEDGVEIVDVQDENGNQIQQSELKELLLDYPA
jgi:hypothetical protein